jgi:hypothetical protein
MPNFQRLMRVTSESGALPRETARPVEETCTLKISASITRRIMACSKSAALIIALFGAAGVASAGGRSNLPDSGEASRGLAPPRPTIESVSLEAQREIRACPDDAAFQCVAGVLARYGAALQTVTPSH